MDIPGGSVRGRSRELPNLPLEDISCIAHLYAERGSPKYEKAALRWLERFLTEHSPRLQHFASVAADLLGAMRDTEKGGRLALRLSQFGASGVASLQCAEAQPTRRPAVSLLPDADRSQRSRGCA